MKSVWMILLLVFFGFFFSSVIMGNVFYCCDNFLINIPTKVYSASEIAAGRFPHWNPYILSGMPFFADINLSVLFPTTFLFMFLSPFVALSLSVLLCILHSMVGMYVLVYTYTKSHYSGAVAGVVWGLSGTMITYINNIPMLQSASLLPWVILFIHLYLHKPTSGRFAGIICTLALSVFGGYAPFIYYTWLLVICLILLSQSKLSLRDRIILISRIIFSVISLTAIQLLPFIELGLRSSRFGLGYEYSSFGSLHPFSIIRFFIPTIVGNDNAGTSWILGGSINGYIGIVGLFLASFAHRKNSVVIFYRGVAIVSFLLALGSFTLLHKIAYKIIPGISLFRSPQNMLLLTTFSLSILAGIGATQLFLHRLSLKKTTITFIVFGSIGVISFVALGIADVEKIVANWSWLFPQKVYAKIAFMGVNGMKLIWMNVWQNILIDVGVGMCIVWMWSRKSKTWFFRLVLFLMIFVELWEFVRPTMILGSRSVVNKWLDKSKTTAAHVREVSASARIYTDQKSFPYQIPHVFGQGYWEGESEWQAILLRPNINVLHRLQSIDGYSSMVLRTYTMYRESNSTDPTGINLSEETEETLKKLGVQTLITTNDTSVSGSIRLKYLQGVNGMYCQGCTVVSTKQYLDSSMRVEIDSENTQQAYTYLTYYPGWQATLDGNATKVFSSNGFISVRIPAGKHTIVFSYISYWFYVGFVVSIITALLLFRRVLLTWLKEIL